uniref:Uncharacterized protein n=1 Tax=Triticum urartu TaxID=4572 RepID=A0A8R7U0M3_TRIUA
MGAHRHCLDHLKSLLKPPCTTKHVDNTGIVICPTVHPILMHHCFPIVQPSINKPCMAARSKHSDESDRIRSNCLSLHPFKHLKCQLCVPMSRQPTNKCSVRVCIRLFNLPKSIESLLDIPTLGMHINQCCKHLLIPFNPLPVNVGSNPPS